MDVVSFVKGLVKEAGKIQLEKLIEVIVKIVDDLWLNKATGDKWKDSINPDLKEEFDKFERESLDAVHLAALLVPPKLVLLPGILQNE